MSADLPAQTIWVKGHPGWQDERNLTSLAVLGGLLGLAVLGGLAAIFSDPAPAMKLLALGGAAATAVGGWMLAIHARVRRVRVVRASVTAEGVRFGGTEGLDLPLRLLAPIGLLILAAWVWAFLTVPSERMPTLVLLVVPLVAAALVYGGARAWFRLPGSHSLTLTPEGVRLRIPRNDLDADWDDVDDVQPGTTRVVVESTRPASWGVSDLASDPVILADLLRFYARTPAARAEIGEGTLERLRAGDLPATPTAERPPSAGRRRG